MTPEEKSLLERAAALAEENNKILRSMRRAARWDMAMRIVYWAVILGLSYSAYAFVRPYIDTLLGSLGQLQSGLQDLQSTSQSATQLNAQLKNFLK